MLNLPENKRARDPAIKPLSEINVSAFSMIGRIIADFNFKAKSSGSAIFFNFPLRASEENKKTYYEENLELKNCVAILST